VLAASVLREGEIEVDVTRTGGDTTAARIVRIIQDAGTKPMTLQRQTERFADRVVLPTIALAVGAGAVTGDLGRTTSVLITDFGTGIRIAAPTSALAAMSAAARAGVLVKGAQYLERLSKADVVVFDKTGRNRVGPLLAAAKVPSEAALLCLPLASPSAWTFRRTK
jgi:Cu2+-exporting ATPase